MIKSFSDLDDNHIDVLRELGNIGAGNAATSLSVILNESVMIDVPQVKVLDYDEVVRSVGDPEGLGIAIMIGYSGDINGVILFILSQKDAINMSEKLLGKSPEEKSNLPGAFSDMNLSMIEELGNIMGCSYLGSIGSMTGFKFEISVPSVSIDMIGAILSAPMLLFSVDNSKILLIEDSFLSESLTMKSHVILFADVPSFSKILSIFKVEG